MRWSLHQGATLRWREIGDQQLVYQEESGDTHFLNPVSVALLKLLHTGNLDQHQLVEQTCQRFELSADEMANQIQEALEVFERYGVLESSEK